MKEFHPNENVTDDAVMDGEVSVLMGQRSAIKLSAGPKIMVAVPIGPKPVTSVLNCPQCATRGEEHTEMQVDDGYRPEAMVPVQFMIQQMNWLPPLNVTMGYTWKWGMRSPNARQIMTQECLRMPTPPEYIFYVDDDMIIPPTGLYQLYSLMERHKDWGAVTGVYSTRQSPPEPLIYTKHGQGPDWDFEMGPGAQPTQIMGCGAGVMLARVSAIKSWMELNPEEPIWADSVEYPAANGGRVTWGHDVRFIRNLTEAGWPCYVDGSLICGHYDLKTNQIFSVPSDAPGLKKRMTNSETYWDTVFTREGADTWRQYPDMFKLVMRALENATPFGESTGARNGYFHDRVVLELGCGPGVLGSHLVGQFPVKYVGTDLSEVAVAQCQARGLQAYQLDLHDLDIEDLSGVTDVIATELLEHLDEVLLDHVMERLANATTVEQLIVTVPDRCMPPEEVPEHERVFDPETMQQLLEKYGWTKIQIQDKEQVDGTHMVVLAKRE